MTAHHVDVKRVGEIGRLPENGGAIGRSPDRFGFCVTARPDSFDDVVGEWCPLWRSLTPIGLGSLATDRVPLSRSLGIPRGATDQASRGPDRLGLSFGLAAIGFRPFPGRASRTIPCGPAVLARNEPPVLGAKACNESTIAVPRLAHPGAPEAHASAHPGRTEPLGMDDLTLVIKHSRRRAKRSQSHRRFLRNEPKPIDANS